MAGRDQDCLGLRVEQIQQLIQKRAVFQAGALIRGGRSCAATQGCSQWLDCAERHALLRDDLGTLLSGG